MKSAITSKTSGSHLITSFTIKDVYESFHHRIEKDIEGKQDKFSEEIFHPDDRTFMFGSTVNNVYEE